MAPSPRDRLGARSQALLKLAAPFPCQSEVTVRSTAILFFVCSPVALLSACSVEDRDFGSGSAGSGGSVTTSSSAGGVGGGCAADCNDNDACTEDTCDAGSCVNMPINIDDKDVCTIDLCDTQSGPSHTAIAVDDS